MQISVSAGQCWIDIIINAVCDSTAEVPWLPFAPQCPQSCISGSLLPFPHNSPTDSVLRVCTLGLAEPLFGRAAFIFGVSIRHGREAGTSAILALNVN
jgi:hypothetical protein